MERMHFEQLTIVKASDRPGFNDWVWSFNRGNWPEFMYKDKVAAECWPALERAFGEYQFAITEKATGAIVAQVNSIPLAWDRPLDDLPDTGWDWALCQGVDDHRGGKPPRIQCALQIAIGPEWRGQGISAHALEVMKQIGRAMGLNCLVAPVRPNRKAEFPLMSMDAYCQRTGEDGLPFDPWLRVHIRAGGKILRVCHQSMLIVGSVKEWEEWTGMKFETSGSHIVPGALVPLMIDHRADIGRYIEPNVWVRHDL
ncbi:GNAT family N-acetyltransferase [candidate division GN15 bacterium]|uniref:GNAT family N-acetyltransferase n=1 Tax=candidate division GN15 bacterium TaxID=2072418 RepID=A0A855XB29_9BACT|nr:MAG: GNAT family N-acetyltransferase [candidate division GN15 bacterium]